MYSSRLYLLALSYEAILVYLIIFAIILVYIFIRTKRNLIRDIQKNVLVQNPELISLMAFAVRHKRRASFFAGLMEICGSGILTITPEGVQYLGYKGRRIPDNLSVAANEFEVVWLGKVMPLSPLYWLVVKDGSTKHYFTAETGKTFSANKEETKEIYDYICSQVSQ
ncbi:hypothetical protein [Phosphitispora sp. TUW77]|uniref:hypothetical protein n=1 Tax=Phosphitispora sp. TUW77 TaxID=3152361 RepID=UPI003AB7A2D9